MTTRVEPTDADIEDWIDGATFVQVKVDIHRNPALWAELEPLYRLIEAAQSRLDDLRAADRDRQPDATLVGTEPSTAPAGEHTLGDAVRTPASVVDAQADLKSLTDDASAIYDRYEADKETWTIRGLDQSELQRIVAAHDRPAATAPVRKAGEKLDHYKIRAAAYIEQVGAFKLAIDEDALSRAVVDVVVCGEHKPPPTVEGLRRLRDRPHGQRHWQQLIEAMESVTLHEVTIPAPHR